jgi:hypothetical protein
MELRRRMEELAIFWLPIVGGILLGSIAVSAWYSGTKVAALWWGFGGLVCFLLAGTLQIQTFIKKTESLPDQSAMQRDRAYVHVVEGGIEHPLGLPPTVSVIIKNAGNTTALDLTWTARFILAKPDAPDGEFTFSKHDNSPILLGPNETLSYRYTFPDWKPEFDALIEKRQAAFFAFGEIRYKDVFGNPRFTDYRLLSGGRFDLGLGITPGKWGAADKGNRSN